MPKFLAPIGAIGAPTTAPAVVGTNTTTSADGLWFGTDTVLHRAAAGNLKTPGVLQVGTGVAGAGTTSTVTAGGANRTSTDWGIVTVAATDATFGADKGGSILFAGPVADGGDPTGLARIAGNKTSAVSGEQGGYLVFHTRPTGGSQTERLRITEGGLVGIGANTAANGLLTVGTNTNAASGGMYFGTDTNLYRSTTSTLKTDGSLQVAAIAGISATPSTDRLLNVTGTPPGSQNTTYGAAVIPIAPATSTTGAYGLYVRTDTAASAFTVGNLFGLYVAGPSLGAGSAATIQHGLHVAAQTVGGTGYGVSVQAAKTATIWVSQNTDSTNEAGGIVFGSSRDTNLYRAAANILRTDDEFRANGDVISQIDGTPKVGIGARGPSSEAAITFGTDTSLYRSAADILKTDDSLFVAATASIGGAAAPTGDFLLRTQGSLSGSGGFKYGAYILPTFNSSTGTGSGAVVAAGTAAAAFTVSTLYGLQVIDAVKGAGSTISGQVGLYVAPQTQGGTNYGVQIGACATQTLMVSANADNTTAAAGISFGSSRDTNLYRSAANTLKTDDDLVVGGAYVSIGTNPASAGALRLANFDAILSRNGANNGDVTLMRLTTDNTVNLAPGGGLVSVTGALSIGTNPASAGALRLPNNNTIYARNSTNTADYRLIGLDSSNVVQINQDVRAIAIHGAITSDTTVTFADHKAALVTGRSTLRPHLDGRMTWLIANPIERDYHDIFRFGTVATPTEEIYSAGAWSSRALTTTLFDGSDRTETTVLNSTNTAIRWTWASGMWAAAVNWIRLNVGYFASPTANITLTTETSPDGSAWTVRDTIASTGILTTGAYFPVSEVGGSDVQFRLTITLDNAASNSQLVLSGIQGLTMRPGSQGFNRYVEFPYRWDYAKNIAFGGSNPANGIVTVGSNTTAATGGMYFGTDTNLYRLAGSSLKTDGAFTAGGKVSGVLGAFTNSNTSTSAFTAAAALAVQNTSNTTNNWAEVAFNASGGTVAAGFGIRIVDQANAYGEMGFYTRNAAGWAQRGRFNSSGLLTTNYGHNAGSTSQVATLGTNAITNGTFDTDATGWTLGAGWAWNTAAVLHTVGNTATMTQALSGMTSGGYYHVGYVITGRTAGSISIDLGSNVITGITASSGRTLIAGSATPTLTITPTTDFDGSVDTITVQLITASDSQLNLTTNAEVIRAEARSDGSNVAFGIDALELQITGSGVGNTAMGTRALRRATGSGGLGDRNVAVGYEAGRDSIHARFTTLVGYQAGLVNEGTGTVAVGYQALLAATTSSGSGTTTNGGMNVGVGYFAGGYVTTGTNNVFVGPSAGSFSAGTAVTTGALGVFIGSEASYTATGFTNQPGQVVVIGRRAAVGAGYSIAIGSGVTCDGQGSVAIGVAANGTAATTSTNNTIQLGTSAHNVNAPGTLTVAGAATLNGTLSVPTGPVGFGTAPDANQFFQVARTLGPTLIAANGRGAYITTTISPTANISSYAKGMESQLYVNVPTSVTYTTNDNSLTPLQSFFVKQGPGTITSASGMGGGWHWFNDGAVNAFYNLMVPDLRQNGGTGTVGTAYGIYINTQKTAFVTTAYGLYQVGANDSNVLNGPTTINNTLSLTNTLSLSGTAPQLSLTNGTSNWIAWTVPGLGAPTFTTRSAGTKLVLYPVVDATNVDYGVGVESAHMWLSVRQATSTYGFKFYGGTTQVARLDGSGVLALSAALAVGTNPASAGTLRLPNNTYVTFRNAANSGNVAGLSLDTLDELVVGDQVGASHIIYNTAGRHFFNAGAATAAVIGAGFVSIGTNPAGAGVLRMPYTFTWYGRNAANNADVALLDRGASYTALMDPAQIVLNVGGSNPLLTTGSAMTLNASVTMGDARNFTLGTTTGTKFGTATTEKMGWWNATPVVQNTGWSVTAGYTADKAFNPEATTLTEVARVLGTLIDTLKTYGLVGA